MIGAIQLVAAWSGDHAAAEYRGLGEKDVIPFHWARIEGTYPYGLRWPCHRFSWWGGFAETAAAISPRWRWAEAVPRRTGMVCACL